MTGAGFNLSRFKGLTIVSLYKLCENLTILNKMSDLSPFIYRTYTKSVTKLHI
jgi:hypothetical protein